VPDFELWHALVLIAAGTLGGFINVMAGGGSIITVPVLLFLGVPGPVANGSNRIAILAQNLTALSTFRRAGRHHLRLGLSLALCATPGAVLGAWIGAQLSGEAFNRVLAGVMLAVMVLMASDRGRPSGNTADQPRRLWLGHVLMVAAGFWGGFIQIGMGFLLMPILNRVMGLDLVTTNVLKVTIVAVYTAAALAVFATTSEVLWLVGGVLAIGNALGGFLGARLTLSRGELWIRRVLFAAITAMVIKLLFFT
jgi:uncharacterized membrane protein YfcA